MKTLALLLVATLLIGTAVAQEGLSVADIEGVQFVGFDAPDSDFGGDSELGIPQVAVAIPEPATLSILGLGALTLLRRKRS